MAAKIAKQVHVVTSNKVGMLAEVTGVIAGAGANIETLCAYAVEDKANFLIVTSNNAKAIGALKAYEVKEEDVVVVEMENKVGTAADMAKKIKAANIDLHYIYGTTSGRGPAAIVFNSNNNAQAVKVLA